MKTWIRVKGLGSYSSAPREGERHAPREDWHAPHSWYCSESNVSADTYPFCSLSSHRIMSGSNGHWRALNMGYVHSHSKEREDMKTLKAIAVYTIDGDLYTKQLFTDEEIEAVKAGKDSDVEEWKSYIIFGDNLRAEDHT